MSESLSSGSKAGIGRRDAAGGQPLCWSDCVASLQVACSDKDGKSVSVSILELVSKERLLNHWQSTASSLGFLSSRLWRGPDGSTGRGGSRGQGRATQHVILRGSQPDSKMARHASLAAGGGCAGPPSGVICVPASTRVSFGAS